MAGGSISVETVEAKPMHIEAVVGVVAIVIAALVAVLLLMVEINAGSVIRAVGLWTATAYSLLTACLVVLIAFLAFAGWVLCGSD